MLRPLLFRIFLILISGIIGSAHAQIRVEIAGVGATQIPIAIAAFANETAAPHQISAIIKADLERCGYFKVIETGTAISETANINTGEWKSKGANALVVGSVQRLADGRYDIRYKLLDTINSSQLSTSAAASEPQLIRVAAHKIADDIYEKMLGIKGVFATRIAYVTKEGKQYRLDIADADGEGVLPARKSGEPIISPSWSPDGRRLAYVSFEQKKPIVYIHDLPTGQQTIVANFKGNNSAPAWSPDGSKLALALSRDGHTQVYIINADGSGLRRLSNSSGIDTEPQFSPDGQSIYFTSDRSGGPQIYRMSFTGGSEAQRITFNGSYNISPRISPDGKTLAFISRRDGRFQLYSMDLTNGQELKLSETDRDESPSFAPNGKYIMYATEIGRRGSLEVVSVDGSVKYRLTPRAGDIREPTWGPFMK